MNVAGARIVVESERATRPPRRGLTLLSRAINDRIRELERPLVGTLTFVERGRR